MIILSRYNDIFGYFAVAVELKTFLLDPAHEQTFNSTQFSIFLETWTEWDLT